MKILAVESSAISASVAICEDEHLIGQTYQQTGLTHSQTLLPMVNSLLSSLSMNLDDIDLLAVAIGPGSFTGLRIGVSMVKGFAWAKNISCVACSTLESMAWNMSMIDGDLCSVMDARRGQVYNARFKSQDGSVIRITEDRPISLDDLAMELQENTKTQWLLGDGAEVCYEYLKDKGIKVRLAPENLRFQQAWGVARLALENAKLGKTITGSMLEPNYLRVSQAERERQEKSKIQ